MRWTASSRLRVNHICLLLVLLSLLVPQVTCSTIATWLTAPHDGPQFVLQDPKTGDITHNLCNSNGTPIYPIKSPRKLPLKSAAKIPTSLAAAGWWDGKTVWASIFYQNNNNELVNGVFQCDMSTGDYISVESTALTSGTTVKGMPSVDPNTGLAVDLLGASAGYAVFFHDTNGSVNYLLYNQDVKWSYGGKMSPDQYLSGKALAAGFFSINNMTVVMPKDSSNFETAIFNSDNTWSITTFPSPLYDSTYSSNSNTTNPSLDSFSTPSTTLKAWNGGPKALGVAADKDLRRYVFYIGSDSNLHLVTSTLSNGAFSAWDPAADKENTFWPKAQEAGADFAMTYNPASYDIILIYRDEKGSLTMLNQSSSFGSWNTAIPIPTERPPPPPVPSNGTTPPADTSAPSLSTGQQAGIGVGAAVGALLIGTLGVAAFILRRRRRRTDEAARAAATAEVGHDIFGHPESYQYHNNQQQWLHQPAMEAGPIPWEDHKKGAAPIIGGEMASSPLPRPPSELPSQFQVSHELAGDGRASSISQHVVYIPSAGQVLDASGQGKAGPSSPMPGQSVSPQPSSRWSGIGGHMSPAPAYVARESGQGFEGIQEEGGGYDQHEGYQGYGEYHSPVASPPPQQQLQQQQQQMGGGYEMMPDLTYMHENGGQFGGQNENSGGYYPETGEGQHFNGQNPHYSGHYNEGGHDGGQYGQGDGPIGQAYGATGASPVDVRGSGQYQGPPEGQDEMFMQRPARGQ